MLSALRLTYLTCCVGHWVTESIGAGSFDDVKTHHTHFSSTKLLTRVTMADKLVLVNPFWWNNHLFKPRFPLERWALGLGFFCPHWTPMMDSIYLTYPYQTLGKIKNEQQHAGRTSICDIIVVLILRHHVASGLIQNFLEVFFMFFQYEMRYLVVSKKAKKRIHYLCEGGIEKSVPCDHRLSSLGKPRDVIWWSLRQIFLAYRIRISENLPWEKKSYLTQAILPRLSREGYIHWLYWNSSTWSSSDVIVMFKWRHHVQLHLSVFIDFWKLILK